MSTIKWMLHLLAPYKLRVLAGSLLVALTVLGNAGLLATSGLLLSKAAITTEVLLLMPLITGVRFFGIGRALMRYAERLLNHSIAFRILGFLRKDFYEHLEPLVPDAMPNYSKGKLYNQFISDIQTLQYFYLKAVSVPVGSLIVFVVTAVFLWQYVPILVVPLAVGHLLAGIVVPFLATATDRSAKECLALQKDETSEAFLEYKQGLTDLKLYQKASEVEKKLTEDFKTLTTQAYRMSAKKRLVNRGVFVLSHLTMLVVLLMLANPVAQGGLEGVEVAMLALLVLASFEAVMQLPEAMLQMDESIASAKSLQEAYKKEAMAKTEGTAEPRGHRLVAENVCFSYHDDTRQLIENLSLTIEEGTHVAFVGESGSGKSSIAHLLSGLWQLDGGSLTLGGVPIGDVPKEKLRRTVVSCEQTSYFFYATIRENLLLARDDATDEELWQAMEMVELGDVVRALPEGLDTILAENAAMLSGGQRQRLAIARLVVTNPQVVILDEALQKLDRALAERILSRLLAWGRNKTMIIISHSLECLNILDFAYVISYGSIIEQGVPSALLQKKDSAYRAFYDIEQSQF